MFLFYFSFKTDFLHLESQELNVQPDFLGNPVVSSKLVGFQKLSRYLHFH